MKPIDANKQFRTTSKADAAIDRIHKDLRREILRDWDMDEDIFRSGGSNVLHAEQAITLDLADRDSAFINFKQFLTTLTGTARTENKKEIEHIKDWNKPLRFED